MAAELLTLQLKGRKKTLHYHANTQFIKKNLLMLEVKLIECESVYTWVNSLEEHQEYAALE